METVRDITLEDNVSRESIERLENIMLQMPQLEIQTEHTFGPGFYARTITIPEDAVLTGRVHKTEHIFMVVRGDITLVTEKGRMRVQGGFQCISPPGTKRAGYAHVETVCTNIHITEETDMSNLERLLVESVNVVTCDTPTELPEE